MPWPPSARLSGLGPTMIPDILPALAVRPGWAHLVSAADLAAYTGTKRPAPYRRKRFMRTLIILSIFSAFASPALARLLRSCGANDRPAGHGGTTGLQSRPHSPPRGLSQVGQGGHHPRLRQRTDHRFRRSGHRHGRRPGGPVAGGQIRQPQGLSLPAVFRSAGLVGQCWELEFYHNNVKLRGRPFGTYGTRKARTPTTRRLTAIPRPISMLPWPTTSTRASS